MKKTQLLKNGLISCLVPLTLLSAKGFAADSTWLLCDNGKLAVNLLEHRAADGMGRVTSLLLLLGANLFKGELVNVDAGEVSLQGNAAGAPGENVFAGNLAVNYATKNLVLKGTLITFGQAFNVDATLKCKELRPKF